MAEHDRRLLLVDDDRRVRRALRTLGAAAGHKAIVEAADATAARSEAIVGETALAVVEPMLPTLAEGCALIRDLDAHGVVVLGLSLRPEARTAACDSGAAAFFTKNCTPEQLLEGIDRLLTHSVVRSAGRP
jgi:DNA-binding response OmpR family regulator